MNKPTATMPKGGKRDNAGRPARNPASPLSGPKDARPIAARLPPELREQFEQACKERGVKEADAIRAAIALWIEADTAPT